MEGVDYFDTFSPVVKITIIRVILALTTAKSWFLEQLDINNAFLHGDLHAEVYMQPPPDQALFTKGSPNSFTAILVYVDDLVLTGNDFLEIKQVKHILDIPYKIKDVGQLRYFLGLEIARSAKGIHLNQCKYTLSLLEESGTLASKPAKTPSNPSLKLHLNQGTPLPDPSSYRRLVGRLIYLTISRPGISFAVQQLSLFMSDPHFTHLTTARRVLHYLKNSPSPGLLFNSQSTFKLSTFADSDWACCLYTRKSITGFCVFLGSSLISWKTKKQNTVSRSSFKAKYRALGSLVCELQWLDYLFNALHIPISLPTSVYCDNRSTIYLAHNPKGLVHLLPIPSTDQLADVFTKALPPKSFQNFIFKLGLCDLHRLT
ncbi:PREDICTED: uncharacterized protein LOC109327949 [Lupinus angustifolius]|uniref:uncharacterized protein LOC109327949 n=1 Tax=Lupinus angustifolius TaxID=3871 RepID=UPI00092E222D|nr:PREDICTED: uncharacterized protein LOC109327949 [Lupinus angustifolius]